MKFQSFINEGSRNIERPNYMIDLRADMDGVYVMVQKMQYDFPAKYSRISALREYMRSLNVPKEKEDAVWTEYDKLISDKMFDQFQVRLEREFVNILDTVTGLIKAKMQEAALQIDEKSKGAINAAVKKVMKK